MKKFIIPGIMLLVALLCAGVLFLQPLELVNHDQARLSIHFGKTVPIQGIAEAGGGYRCYVSEDEYFWVSSNDCEVRYGGPLRVAFSLTKPTIIYRSEVE